MPLFLVDARSYSLISDRDSVCNIFEAACEGNIDRVLSSLKGGMDIDRVDKVS